MKKSGDFYVYVAVIAFAVLIIGYSLGMQYVSSKTLPLIIGGSVLALAVAGLLRELFVTGKTKADLTEDDVVGETATEETWPKYLRAGLWVLGFALTTYFLGFILATLLFMFSYMKRHGSRWLSSIISAVATTAVEYIIFIFILKVYLWEGFFFLL